MLYITKFLDNNDLGMTASLNMLRLLASNKNLSTEEAANISLLAAKAAGLRVTEGGSVCINGPGDAAAYYEAYKDLNSQTSYLSDPRYLKLENRVNSFNIEEYKKEFVLEVFPILLQYEEETNIPAEIMFGQICIESSYGEKTLIDKYTGKVGNNYFGYKGVGPAGSVTCDTSEYVKGIKINIEDDFRAYNSISESIDDYTKLLNDRYKEYITTGTPEDWVNALEQGGYATAPNYGDEILGTAHTWRVY